MNLLGSPITVLTILLLTITVIGYGPAGAQTTPQSTAPRINDIAPFSAMPDTTIKATIRGANLESASAVTFEGPGITAKIEQGGTATSLPVTIILAADAPIGTRAFTVTTPNGSTPRFAGFAVAQPVISDVLPRLAFPGVTMPMTINGKGLASVSSMTISGNGATAVVTRATDQSVETRVTVSRDAPLGPRSITLITRGGVRVGAAEVSVIPDEGIIRTIAGNGKPGSTGDGGPATAATMDGPFGLAADDSGNLFLSAGNLLRKITPDGNIQTVASGVEVPSDAGPPATRPFGRLEGIALDSAGNIFVADSERRVVYKISGAKVEIVAGSGKRDDGKPMTNFGDNGPAREALLDRPTSVAVDRAGALYFVDINHKRVRKVTRNGVITTIAGGATNTTEADGVPATEARIDPVAVAIDKSGAILIAETKRIRKIAPDGTISTIAGGGNNNSRDYAPALAAVIAPASMAIDSAGNLFLVDGDRVRTLTPEKIVVTVAGGGNRPVEPPRAAQNQSNPRLPDSADYRPARGAWLDKPGPLAIDARGNLYVGIRGAVRMVSADRAWAGR